MAPPKKACIDYWVDRSSWKFRGDFEGMYRDIDDPWGCQAEIHSLTRDLLLLLLSRQRQPASVIDVGCGLGGFTERLRQALRPARILGVDVSATAVSKAAGAYPECEFRALNILDEELPGVPGGAFGLVVLSEVLWYLLPKLAEVFAKVHRALEAQGVLALEQYFPAQQNFGKEYLGSPEELISRYLRPAGFVLADEVRRMAEDGCVVVMTLRKS